MMRTTHITFLAGAVLLALLLATRILGQGLPRDTRSIVGADSSYESLKGYLQRSKSWRAEFVRNPAAACNTKAGTLCGAAASQQANIADQQLLALATSPATFDLRNSSLTGGIRVLSPVQDQGSCQTCASFAAAAAAETALAVALGRDATPVLSVQDLHFCSSLSAGYVRDCSSPWSLQDAFDSLIRLSPAGKPTTPACLPYDPNANNLCAFKCREANRQLQLGRGFQVKRLSGLLDVQQWLRTHGAVVTSIQVYPDLAPFFARNPKAVYMGPGPKLDPNDCYGHAITIVGYNNEQQYWLAKNSWGKSFGDGGFFKVGYGKSGVGDPSNTFGLRFMPFMAAGGQPAAAPRTAPPDPARLSPAKGKPGCYNYKARADDYASKVAAMFKVPVQRVLLDNLGVVTQPDMLLSGKTLLLCGSQLAGKRSQLEVLLSIKAAIDETGVLASWRAGACEDASVCCNDAWLGVVCDAEYNVTRISLKAMGLVGVLPSADDLLALPKLARLGLGNNSLSGTLEVDWGKMRRLREVYLWNNRIVGTLPVQWQGMKSLQYLELESNQLTGTLPAEWGALSKLKEFTVSDNALIGTLPKQWVGMADLQYIELQFNQLFGSLPAEWGALSKLKELYVNNNALIGTLPKQWVGMADLQYLELQSNQLFGSLPAEWGALSKLKQLYVSDNALTGSLPKQWAGMAEIRNLSVSNNQLVGPIPLEWVPGMRKLVMLLCFLNRRLTGCIPAVWKDIVNGPASGILPYLKKLGDVGVQSAIKVGTNITGYC